MDAKIADLGSVLTGNQSWSRTNGIYFTDAYAAPEFFARKTMHNSDIYSFGCVLFKILAKKSPWSGLNFKALGGDD